MLKKKFIISGEKVNEVGYRILLLNKALSLGLDNFNVYNVLMDDIQQVTVLFEGDEDEYNEFSTFIKTKMPEKAKVGDVAEKDHLGRVPPIERCLQAFQMDQWGRGIPTLLEIRDNTHKTLEKQDEAIVTVREESEKTREKLSSVIEGEGEKTREALVKHLPDDIAELKQEIAEIKATLSRVLQKVEA